MDNCSKHSKEILGVSDMKVLAEMIGDLHYESLMHFLYQLAKKINSDADKDYKLGLEKNASALQYLGMSIMESAYRSEKVWQISKPFMIKNK